MRVRALRWEDPLDDGMATHSSILVWRNPWMEEPGGLQSIGSQSWTRLSDFTFFLSFLSAEPWHQSLGGDLRPCFKLPQGETT